MTSSNLKRLLGATALCTTCVFALPSSAQEYLNTETRILGKGISDDGSVVIGNTDPLDGGATSHAMVWTEPTGFTSLDGISRGVLFKLDTQGISGDGSVITGSANNSIFGSGTTGNRAYRWTQAGGFQDLGSLGSNNSTGLGISADGNVIVGGSYDADGRLRAMRWTAVDGMVSLGEMDADEVSASAYATSGDGVLAVGISSGFSSPTYSRAFSWTEGTGMVALATLEGGSSNALDVSYDGRVIGGSSQMGGHQVAVRWVDGVVSALGQTDRGSIAYAVSGNGKVAVGDISSPGIPSGFRWDDASGLVSIEQWLRSSGATISDGSTYTARAINCDGSVVVGGTFPSGAGPFPRSDLYIARGNGTGSSTCSYSTDTSGGDGGAGDGGTGGGGTGDGGTGGGGGVGLIMLNDLQNSLLDAASANTAVVGGLGLLLNGAGSRPLDRRTTIGKSIIWVGGDLGRTDRDSQDSAVALGEIGYGRNFGAFQINGALGITGSSAKTLFGGKTEVLSTYAKLEGLYKLHSTESGGIWALVSGSGLLGKADISRNYLTGGGIVDSSDGRTDVYGFGLRARLQWENLLPYTSPYGEFAHVSACMDGYKETGGAFPARFNTQCERSNELRAGVDAKVPVTDKISVTGTLEAVHRLDSDGSGVSGQVIGLGSFDFDGGSRKQNWLRAGLGIETQLGEATLSLMGNVTTEGGAPQHWIASKLSLQF
ncbi:autotransporter domain-containing protein [Pararhizobium sp. IMCC21322]|uniref:autotransporter domain-containing protein n=1 Tax=Pararhizobium sp. IMCC21322 TaxID=3067903 RepID=UPI0027417963|nr:autotransporter domain-containing protein [Pararhizobium sp. IMCC21322]